MKFEIASDQSVILYLDDKVSEKSIKRLKSISLLIDTTLQQDLVDLIPSYCSILIIFNPITTSHDDVKQRIITAFNEEMVAPTPKKTSELIRLPVYYSLHTGPDLERIAAHHKVEVGDVIKWHYMNVYRVYAIGFAPGFAYLGEVDSRIAMPRLSTPRPSVPIPSLNHRCLLKWAIKFSLCQSQKKNFSIWVVSYENFFSH